MFILRISVRQWHIISLLFAFCFSSIGFVVARELNCVCTHLRATWRWLTSQKVRYHFISTYTALCNLYINQHVAYKLKKTYKLSDTALKHSKIVMQTFNTFTSTISNGFCDNEKVANSKLTNLLFSIVVLILKIFPSVYDSQPETLSGRWSHKISFVNFLYTLQTCLYMSTKSHTSTHARICICIY